MHTLNVKVKRGIASYFRNDFRAQRNGKSGYGTRKRNQSSKHIAFANISPETSSFILGDTIARQFAKAKAVEIHRKKLQIVNQWVHPSYVPIFQNHMQCAATIVRGVVVMTMMMMKM